MRGFCSVLLMSFLATSFVTAQDKQELRIWILSAFSDTVLAAWDQAVADFEAANPDIKITLEGRAVDAHKDAMRVAAGTDGFP